jgi:hypothetical protein
MTVWVVASASMSSTRSINLIVSLKDQITIAVHGRLIWRECDMLALVRSKNVKKNQSLVR